jgi:hypothetical protein
MIFFLYQ